MMGFYPTADVQTLLYFSLPPAPFEPHYFGRGTLKVCEQVGNENPTPLKTWEMRLNEAETNQIICCCLFVKDSVLIQQQEFHTPH